VLAEEFTPGTSKIQSVFRPAAHRYEGHLLQVPEVPLFIGFSLGWLDLLNGRLCRQGSKKIFPIHLSKGRQFR
jgi:hypothetical protein